MADRTYQLSSSPLLPVVIAIVAGLLAIAVFVAHFSGRTWFAQGRRPNFMGRVGKWVRVQDPAGSEWQLISYRTGSIPPVGAPSLLPGPVNLFGEGPAPILGGLLLNRTLFRAGWTVAVGPLGSSVGSVVLRRCADRRTADELVEHLVEAIQTGSWNPDWRDMPG